VLNQPRPLPLSGSLLCSACLSLGPLTASCDGSAMAIRRFVFTLDQALPVPHGWSYEREDVTLRFLHAQGASDMLTRIKLAAEVGDQFATQQNDLANLGTTRFTVVIATTTARQSTTRVVNDPRELLPTEDALTRVLQVLDQMLLPLRAAALGLHGAGAPSTIGSYERLPPFILQFTADSIDDETTCKWTGNLLALANVQSTIDPGIPNSDELRDLKGRFDYYDHLVQVGSPLVPILERMTTAQLALDRDGNYVEAILSAVTGIEVLLFKVLSSVIWDCSAATSTENPECVVAIMEKRAVESVQAPLSARIKGQWGNPSDYYTWRHDAYVLRNRVIHRAYRPTRPEARRAVEQSLALQTFVFNQLGAAARRKKYVRTALMFLGREGLERRNAWTRHVREIATNSGDAHREFMCWDDQVLAIIDQGSAGQ